MKPPGEPLIAAKAILSLAMLKPTLAFSDHHRPLPESGPATAAALQLAMNGKELHRLSVVQQVLERRLTGIKAAELLGIGVRQVSRLCAAYRREGAAGLISRKRGRVGNRKLASNIETQVVELASRFYQNCGPTMVRDKLAEQHGIKLAKETVRKILSRAGLWLPKDQRGAQRLP